MKLSKLIIMAVVNCVMISSCRRATPYIPFDQYNRFYKALQVNDADVTRASKGVYKLYIKEIDTTFSRKKMLYYTTSATTKEARNTDILYLYFIDDYRFYYTKNKTNCIDISTDLDKKTRIGIYKLSRDDIRQESVVLVNLLLADARVKDGQDYQYADMVYELKDNMMDFMTMYYPIHYRSRDSTAANRPDDQPLFGPKIIEQATEKIYNSGLRTFESTGMGFYAQWYFSPEKITTKINGKEFNEVIYSFIRGKNYVVRQYRFNDSEVFREEIHEDRSKNLLFSW